MSDDNDLSGWWGSHDWDAMNKRIDAMVKESTTAPTRSDAWYRIRRAEIERMPKCERHEAYELLLSYISNNHPHGFASDIYEEISEYANRSALK
jgi:transcriptional regulator with PAS, ATPase and Fis domain